VDPEDDKAFQSLLGMRREESGEESVLEKFQTQRTEVETVMSGGV
jgi:hypothetical protein